MERVPTEIKETLAEERQRVSKMCFGGDGISSENLIRQAIKPPIDFIDLYAYHDQALNYRAEEFHRKNPSAKVIHVGLEFDRTGEHERFLINGGVVYSNEFLINYEALAFLRRLKKESVGFINIDFTGLGTQKISLMEEAVRVLNKNGQISFYAEVDSEPNTIDKLRSLGFSSAQSMKNERNDLLDRRPWLQNDNQKIERILATK